MSTIKISDVPKKTCTHPEHNPPSMMVYEDGVWEHTCPGCGNKIVFTIQRPTYLAGGWHK